MSHKKIFLDTKVCLICNRPFAWRKKCEDAWAEVKYCSERCQRNKRKINNGEDSNA